MHTTPDGVTASSVEVGRYRYRLDWRWGGDAPTLMVLMLHPPLVEIDWNTLRIYRLASIWGLSRLLVGGVFARRAGAQGDLEGAGDPIGPDNDQHVVEMAHEADMVLMGFGKPVEPWMRARGMMLARVLDDFGIEMHAMGAHLTGEPWLPQCMPDYVVPQIWRPKP
jgi:hypothetical protein